MLILLIIDFFNFKIGANSSYPKPPPKPNILAQRQSPPIVVRHVFTSNQGIPVTMAVLPQTPSNEVHIKIFCIYILQLTINDCFDDTYKIEFIYHIN